MGVTEETSLHNTGYICSIYPVRVWMPADRRKRVSSCGALPIVAGAVRLRAAKPVALAPSAALRALAAHVHSTATLLSI